MSMTAVGPAGSCGEAGAFSSATNRAQLPSVLRRTTLPPVKISVIVPAFNEERLIAASLGAIQCALTVFTERGWASELIVCDNNSTDHTADLAHAAGAVVVFEPVNQIARARNTGARAATGDWLLFIDADSRPTAGLFADVADAIASGRCLAGGSTMRMDGVEGWALALCRFWNWVSVRRRLLAGSFIFCEAAAFHAVGGFNEALFASEEIDLSRQLKRFAARTGKRLVILDRHPLLTSDRKVRLYSQWEWLWFIARVLLGLGRPLRRRESCYPWYDGRR